MNHGVETLLLGDYVRAELGADPLQDFGVADWLATPTQRLLEFTSGEVFSDPVGELTQLRDKLSWYPHDVWLFAMAGQWRRVAQLEHFVGRTGSRGDDLGSRVIAASLVRDLMRLALLQNAATRRTGSGWAPPTQSCAAQRKKHLRGRSRPKTGRHGRPASSRRTKPLRGVTTSWL